jgi:hypothetical protein
MKYKTMEELLQMIQPATTRTGLYDIYHKLYGLFVKSQGSVHNHQAWEGGYIDHITDAMNIGRLLFTAMNDKRKLPFTIPDVLVVLFLHDLEKLFPDRIETVMKVNSDNRPAAKDLVRAQLFDELGIYHIINELHLGALKCVEGEKDNYTNERRTMTPLAAFCHMCDIASARLWFDRPCGDFETWGWRESSPKEGELWGV